MTEPEETVQAVLAYCRESGRVCPLPIPWNAVWEMLPNRERTASGGWEPGLPLILGAWHHSTHTEKRERLAEHIEWAERHGALTAVAQKLRKLDEGQWLHESD